MYSTGKLDTAFDPGTGANNTIIDMTVLASGRIAVVGLIHFHRWDRQEPGCLVGFGRLLVDQIQPQQRGKQHRTDCGWTGRWQVDYRWTLHKR